MFTRGKQEGLSGRASYNICEAKDIMKMQGPLFKKEKVLSKILKYKAFSLKNILVITVITYN